MNPAKVPVILDSSPLITLCTCKVSEQPIIYLFLEYAHVLVPTNVVIEVAQYTKSDARIASALMKAGRIASRTAPSTPVIRDFYRLDETDCSVIRLGLAESQMLTILDDKEAYVVSTRYGLRPMFFLDLLVLLVRQYNLPKQTALDMVESAQKRYSPSYVDHTVSMLKEV